MLGPLPCHQFSGCVGLYLLIFKPGQSNETLENWKEAKSLEEPQLHTKGPVGSCFTTIISSCRLGLSLPKTTSYGLPSAISLTFYLSKVCLDLT